MLSKDLPIPASFYVFFKKNKMPLYRYDANLDMLTYAESIRSHYFTITGIYLEEKTKKQYLELSSWGKCYYAELDTWLKKRSIFSNILYYQISS